MRSKMSVASAGLLATLTLAFSSTALATNGYFTHGVGAESKGMAGTGIGSNADMGPIIAASNPALAIFADDDWQAGLSIFSPRRSYAASSSLANGQGGAFTIGEGTFDSDSEYFPIPYVAKNWRLQNDRMLSFLFYGRGGMNTDWQSSSETAIFDPDGPGPATPGAFPGPFGGGNAGVDLMQAFASLNYAGKTSDRFAWGIGPVVAVQAFKAKGVGAFAPFTRTFAASGGTVFPTNLTNNGRDFAFGWGVSAGIWFAMSDTVSAGLAYQSKMSMGEFDDYADLFAKSGGFDIPAATKFGLSVKASDVLRVNFDIEYIQYSQIDSVGNPLANIGSCPTAGLGGTDLESCLGGARGAGFGWDDMTVYKLGAEWQASQDYTWRFGYSYGKQPIQKPDVLFNILAPGVMEQHFTLGMTMNRPNDRAWTFSLMFAPKKSVTGSNLFDPTQTLTIEMKQFEFEFGYRW
jgi:long-chain fatty acid transport protein